MNNQPLIDFIKVQIQLGASRDAITAMLLSQGWTSMDVDEAFAALNASSPIVIAPPAAPLPSPPSSVTPVTPAATATPVAQPVSQLPQHHKSHSAFLTILIVLIVLCLGAGGVFAYYQFVQQNSPTQILQNSLQLTFGHTTSLAFAATTTGSVTSTLSTYGLPPSTVTFSTGVSGAADYHTPMNPLANLDFVVHLNGTSGTTSSNSLDLAIDTIYVPKNVYVNIRNINVMYTSVDPKVNADVAPIVAMINTYAPDLENQWIDIPASTTLAVPTATTTNGLSLTDISDLHNYIYGMSYVNSITNIGTENIAGVAVHHLQVTIQDKGQLAALIRRIILEKQPDMASSTAFNTQMDTLSTFLSQQVSIDFWIGVADSRIYKVVFGPVVYNDAQNGLQSNSNFQASFGDYGQVMNITAPQDAVPLQQFIQNAMMTIEKAYSTKSVK
jgi:hypothetical protein